MLVAPDLSLVTHTQGTGIFFPMFTMLREKGKRKMAHQMPHASHRSASPYFPMTFFNAAISNVFLRSEMT